MITLAIKKAEEPPSAPVLGLSVTLPCASTGLPAVGETQGFTDEEADEPGYPVSADILAKHECLPAALKRLTDTVRPADGFAYPRELDDLGRESGESSYIAVVHADGNGMAARFRALAEKHPGESYAGAAKNLSDAVNAAGVNALAATTKALDGFIKEHRNGNTIEYKDSDGEVIHQMPLKPRKGSKDILYLPFRPIVFGGDDVTFVCDGRLGLSLALRFLKEFEIATADLKDGGPPATACAGVAIVKSHYPFARAYALAERLCGSAKTLARRLKEENGKEFSCIDWHLAATGLAGDIANIRRREYNLRPGSLTLRPVAVGEGDGQHEWATVSRGIQAFQHGWAGRRNKAKALREALRESPAEVKWFRDRFNETQLLPEVARGSDMFRKDGWSVDLNPADSSSRQVCGYFDALELMDLYLPLEKETPECA